MECYSSIYSCCEKQKIMLTKPPLLPLQLQSKSSEIHCKHFFSLIENSSSLQIDLHDCPEVLTTSEPISSTPLESAPLKISNPTKFKCNTSKLILHPQHTNICKITRLCESIYIFSLGLQQITLKTWQLN